MSIIRAKTFVAKGVFDCRRGVSPRVFPCMPRKTRGETPRLQLRGLQWLQCFRKFGTVPSLHLLEEETNTMVNEPRKLTGAERGRTEEPVPGQFAIQKGGQEDENYEQLLDQYGGRKLTKDELMKEIVLKITITVSLMNSPSTNMQLPYLSIHRLYLLYYCPSFLI